MWANVENLDQFLNEVYAYYIGHGIYSILLNRAVKLLYVRNTRFMAEADL